LDLHHPVQIHLLGGLEGFHYSLLTTL
jgi:hypothetical protein